MLIVPPSRPPEVRSIHFHPTYHGERTPLVRGVGLLPLLALTLGDPPMTSNGGSEKRRWPDQYFLISTKLSGLNPAPFLSHGKVGSVVFTEMNE